MNNMNVYVKTVHESQKPNITRYTNKETAENMIRAYETHGLGIVSCEIIDEELALAEVRAQKADYTRS